MRRNSLISDVIRFVLWGWIPVVQQLTWFWSLEKKAKKLLSSKDPKKRGLGRSIVRFMCEPLYWETTYLHNRGGWLANRHVKLVDLVVKSAVKAGDSDALSMEQWKSQCYETIGFVGPDRVISLRADALPASGRKRAKRAVKEINAAGHNQPLVIKEKVVA